MKNKYILCIILIKVFFSLNISAKEDTCQRKKFQISIGTNGFYLPEYKKYYFSTLNDDVFSPMLRYGINSANIEWYVTPKISCNLSFDGLLSKSKYTTSELDDPHRAGRFVRMGILSAGAGYSVFHKLKNSNKLHLETKVGGAVEYRIGREKAFAYSLVRVININAPGFKFAISENLVYKKRYVFGINAGFQAFRYNVKEYGDYGFPLIMSNTLYLGIKF